MMMSEPGRDTELLQRRPRPMRAAVVVGGAVAVTLLSALMAGLAVVYLGGPDSSPGQGALPLPGASTTSTQATETSSSRPVQPSPTAQVPTAPTASTRFAYQPLWPFSSVAEAAEWQRRYRDGGKQPWHLDPEQTALAFTTGFLGFTEIDKVVARSIKADDARVSVGYRSSEGRESVAAVIHLVRIGQGSDAPWEVVGTADTTLTLERPRYGATVDSPITVGGRISGVDESIRIDVRQAGSDKRLASECCLSVGGENQPWSTRVTFRGARAGALTIVASTGGHVQTVERFAITGVRTR